MLELDGDFFGRKKKCVGAGISGGEPPWAHEAGGAPRGWARPGPSWPGACPPAVFSVPNILKYSRKKSYFIFRAFGELLFSGYFYCMDKSENRQKNTIFALFNLNNRR